MRSAPTREQLEALLSTPCARLRHLDLVRANLRAADFRRMTADDVNLQDADLREAQLQHATLRNCCFASAMLAQADLSAATVRLCTLDGASAAGARFDGARLEDSTAAGANFSAATLRGSHLTETSFARAVMHHVTLDDAEGEGVEFRGADLTDATLVGARFNDGDFRGADLRRANLSRGHFRSADFRGALLDGTVFDGADVSGAWFDAGASPAAPVDARRPAVSDGPADDAMMATLRTLLAQSPALLSGPHGIPAELLTRLDGVLGEAGHSPADWTSWAQRVAALARADASTDVDAVLNAFADTPFARSATGAANAREALEPLRAAAAALAAANDEPPKEWQPVLAMLMEMTAGTRPADLNALLEGLGVACRREETPPRA